MFNKCCVVSCDSRRKDVSFHKFPKSEIGLRKWLQCINCERLRGLSFQDLRKQFVCRKHFEKKFLASNREIARLRPDAYPTLFSESEISSGIPQTAAIIPDETSNLLVEHEYCRKRQHEDHTYYKSKVVEKRLKTVEEMDVMPMANMIENFNLPSTSSLGRELKENPISSNKVVCNTPTKKRKRFLCIKNKPSPHCARLCKEYAKSQRQLNFNRRAKKALRFSKTKSFVKLTENLNPMAKKFLWMQINQCTKKSRGRRFSNDEKVIAMAIMKQSPKCYKFLQKIFILPSKYTLNKMISELDVEAGINPQIFAAIKEEVQTWDEKKKYCSIIFDEVSLEPALVYNKHKDIINGFVELTKKTNDFADHALVFMLRGALHKWQQPLAFYFCKGATSGTQLKIIIKDLIAAVGNTGLLPIALVSDQGTAFQSALKSLQEDTRREQIIAGDEIDNVIQVDGHKLSVIYDPPHLIKGLRNALASLLVCEGSSSGLPTSRTQPEVT